MGLIIFETFHKSHKVIKEVNQNLFYYEWAKKNENGEIIAEGKMHTLNGGQLRFEYDWNIQSLKVSTAPLQVISHITKDDKEEINKWIKENSDLGLSISSKLDLVVEFPDKNLKLIKSALEDTNFIHEIIEN